MPQPLVYDPVEASRERWIEQGWVDSAAGMAAVVSVMRAEQIFLRRATDVLRPLGLTFARYQVLGMLRWAGPLTLGAVGHRLWITPGTVTSSVDRLEAADLCVRRAHPDDRRSSLLDVTDTGREAAAAADAAVRDELAQRLDSLSARDVDRVASLLRNIRVSVGVEPTVDASTK